MKSSIKKTVLPLLAGLLIFLATMHFIGFEKIIGNLLEINLFLYMLSVGCIFGSIILWVLRWRAFIQAEGYDVKIFDLFKNLLIGISINNLTPLAKIGGEPIRAYLLKKDSGMKMRKGFATILAELTILFMVTVGLVIISLVLIPISVEIPLWIYGIIIPFGITVFLLLFGIIGIYSGNDIITRILKWLGRKIERLEPYQEKILKRYKVFQKTFRDCFKKRGAFLEALVYAIIDKSLGFLKFLLIFWALGYIIDPIKIIIVMGIGLIIFSLPTTPGSLGIYEGGFTATLVLLGVPSGIAGTVIFLDRLIWFWGITAVGGALGIHYGVDLIDIKSISKLKKAREAKDRLLESG